MEWALLAVVVVVILVVILSQGTKKQPWTYHPPSEAHRRPAPVPPGAAAPRGMTAAEMLQRVESLAKANAQWPEIWAQLNPDGDQAVQQLLIDFRGPYMFVPHAAINVLRIGCERALASSPSADRVSAIRAAMRADDQVVRPR